VRERDIEKTEEKERREERRASEWEVLLRAVVCGKKTDKITIAALLSYPRRTSGRIL